MEYHHRLLTDKQPDRTIIFPVKTPESDWGLLYLQSSWMCWQLVDMVRQCRDVVFSRKGAGRTAFRLGWKKAWGASSLPRGLRASWKPAAYYEVPLESRLSQEDKPTVHLTSSGCPKMRMQNYHTDRSGHERVLVRRVAKWQPAETIAKFKAHWLKKGYSIFDEPCDDVEAYYRFDTRKCGLQPDDEIWAVEVTWIEETLIGNLDAPYVPGNRSVWGDVNLD